MSNYRHTSIVIALSLGTWGSVGCASGTTSSQRAPEARSAKAGSASGPSEKPDKSEGTADDEDPVPGTIFLSGSPEYATIRVDGRLEYERVEFRDQLYWTEKRLSPSGERIRYLDANRKHELTIAAPGHETERITIRPEDWTSMENFEVEKLERKVELAPEGTDARSELRAREFRQRQIKDPKTNYHGRIEISSAPEALDVYFDGEPLRNAEGQRRKTPVSFETFFLERDDGKSGLIENRIRVDTPPGRGHRIRIPAPSPSDGLDGYITGVNRPMWTCHWPSNVEVDALRDEKLLPNRCQYEFELHVDFEKIRAQIERHRRRIERVQGAVREREHGENAGG